MSFKIINISKKINLPIELLYLPTYIELQNYSTQINETKKYFEMNYTDNIIAITDNCIYKMENKEWIFDRFYNLKIITDSDSESEYSSDNFYNNF